MRNGNGFWRIGSVLVLLISISLINLSSVNGAADKRCEDGEIYCHWEYDDGRRECDCDRDNDDDNNDNDNNDGLETGALIGLIIGIIAILICVPIIICFCCSCFCFKKREPGSEPPRTVFIVSPPPNSEDVNGNRTDIKIPMDNMNPGGGTRDRQLPMYSNIDPTQGPSAPNFPMRASDEDQEGFYYLGFSNQPPPPYPFPLEMPQEHEISYGNAMSKSRPSYSASEQMSIHDEEPEKK